LNASKNGSQRTIESSVARTSLLLPARALLSSWTRMLGWLFIWKDGKPLCGGCGCHQPAVMLEDHLRRISRFQRHLRSVFDLSPPRQSKRFTAQIPHRIGSNISPHNSAQPKKPGTIPHKIFNPTFPTDAILSLQIKGLGRIEVVRQSRELAIMSNDVNSQLGGSIPLAGTIPPFHFQGEMRQFFRRAGAPDRRRASIARS
jgi:hypothetical protein